MHENWWECIDYLEDKYGHDNIIYPNKLIKANIIIEAARLMDELYGYNVGRVLNWVMEEGSSTEGADELNRKIIRYMKINRLDNA